MKRVHLALLLAVPVAVGAHGAAYCLLRHYDYAPAGCTESRLDITYRWQGETLATSAYRSPFVVYGSPGHSWDPHGVLGSSLIVFRPLEWLENRLRGYDPTSSTLRIPPGSR